MAVFRVERTRNYTIMSNYHLRDKRISLKAKGLLSQMLSLPEDWDYTLPGLASINSEGKDAIRAAVAELERAGYIQRRQTVDKDGKFGNNEYIIREYPVSAQKPQEGPPSAFPSSGFPTTEEPATDLTSADIPTQLNIEVRKKKKKQKLTYESKNRFPSPLPPPQALGKDRKRREGIGGVEQIMR